MSKNTDNAAYYFVERHAAGTLASKPAYIEIGEYGRTLSYAELGEQSGRFGAFFERHDLKREDRVAMLVLDQIEFPIIFWGCIKSGLIPVPLNTLLSSEVYGAILSDCRPRALFVSHEMLPMVKPIIEKIWDLKAVFVIGDGKASSDSSFFGKLLEKNDTKSLPYLTLAERLHDCEEREAIELSPDEVAFWLYSSGTTGKPKGVRHVHGSLIATADTYGRQILEIREDDIVYSVAKLFFAYGLGNAMTFPLSVGATTILSPGRPSPDSVFEILHRHKPSIFCGVPTLYAAMLAAHEAEPKGKFENLRLCISAGEALPEDIGMRWQDAFNMEVLDGVGSTEMLHIFLSNAAGDVKYGTSGKAVPGYELRLVDENNNDAALGEIGEMLVKGASGADNYWNQRDKSRSTFEGIWTRTGDKYEQRPDGRYLYCGRTDDMFKVGGIWVSPFEVEQALISHPSVLEAAVIAASDDEGLEKPKAFVILMPNASQDGLAGELKKHVQEKIGKWKYPRWIEFLEDLPKTATGKIKRFALRDLKR